MRTDDGELCDRREWRTGLRTIDVDDFIWRVNGERLFAKAIAYGPPDRFLTATWPTIASSERRPGRARRRPRPAAGLGPRRPARPLPGGRSGRPADLAGPPPPRRLLVEDPAGGPVAGPGRGRHPRPPPLDRAVVRPHRTERSTAQQPRAPIARRVDRSARGGRPPALAQRGLAWRSRPLDHPPGPARLEPLDPRPGDRSGAADLRPDPPGRGPLRHPARPRGPDVVRRPPLARLAGRPARRPPRAPAALAPAGHLPRRDRGPVGGRAAERRRHRPGDPRRARLGRRRSRPPSTATSPATPTPTPGAGPRPPAATRPTCSGSTSRRCADSSTGRPAGSAWSPWPTPSRPAGSASSTSIATPSRPTRW